MIHITMNTKGECISIDGGNESTRRHMKEIVEKMGIGEQRIIEKFLWKPMKLDGKIKWLTKAKIVQTKRRVFYYHSFGGGWNLTWVNTKFKE